MKVKSEIQLHTDYERGLVGFDRYWEMKRDLQNPELSRSRTALYKPLGYLVKYLGDFEVMFAYNSYMKGWKMDNFIKSAKAREIKTKTSARKQESIRQQTESIKNL